VTDDDGELAVILASFLSGAAKELYSSLPLSERKSFSAITKNIREKLAYRGLIVANYDAFHKIKQLKDEKVLHYGMRLEESFRVAFPNVIGDEQLSLANDVKVAHFVMNLYNDRIRDRVSDRSDGKTMQFNSVMDLARTIEANQLQMEQLKTVKLGDMSSDRNRSGQNERVMRWRTTHTPARPCKDCGKLHWDSDCVRVKSGANAATVEKKLLLSKSVYESAVKCHRCGMVGHFIRDCRQKPKESQGRSLKTTNQVQVDDNDSAAANKIKADAAKMSQVTVSSLSSAQSDLFAPEVVVRVKVGESETENALLDGGAMSSLVAHRYLCKLYKEGKYDVDKNVVDLPATMPKIYSVKGSEEVPLKIIGIAKMVLTTPNGVTREVRLLITDEHMSHVILLGNNLLPMFEYDLIDKVSNRSLYDRKPAISTLKVAFVSKVIIDKTVKIPKMMEKVVEIPIRGKKFDEANEFLLEPKSILLNKQKLFVNESVVAKVKGRKTVRFAISNFGDEDAEVPMNTVLGELQNVSFMQKEEIEKLKFEVSQMVVDDEVSINSVKCEHKGDRDDEQLEKMVDSFDWSASQLSDDEFGKVALLLKEYQHLFPADCSKIGKTDKVEHDIDTGKAHPIKQPMRPCPFAVRESVSKMLKEYLDMGVIEPSQSPWSSQMVLVKKKDVDGKDTKRMVFDYRGLNSVTVKDAYALPRVQDILASLHGVSVMSNLDLNSGYWQVAMAKDAKEKTAFTTFWGHYQWTRMPFGLTNAVATFQRLMENILREFLWKFVFVFVDDVLVVSKSKEEHRVHLKMVFDKISDAGLTLKAKKCRIFASETEYLGHVLTAEGIKPNPRLVEKVSSMVAPKTVPQLRRALGLAGYYRAFIHNYAKKANVLYNLLKKGVNWCWSDECEKAFDVLKTALTTAPVLAYPDFESAKSGKQPFVLQTDASKYGFGAVLHQQTNCGKKLNVIGYWAKSTNEHEQNYSITKLESAALVHALKHFRPFLLGMPVVVYTDNIAVTSLIKLKNPMSQMARWQEALQEFDLTIRYRPGHTMQPADCLSRLFSDDNTVESDANNSEKLAIVVAQLQLTNEEKDEMCKAQQAESEISDMIEYLQTKTLPNDEKYAKVIVYKSVHFSMMDNHLYFVDDKSGYTRLVLPEKYRRELVHERHAGKFAGHSNDRKVYDQLKEDFWWPSMRRDVRAWCRDCLVCATTRCVPNYKAPLTPIPTTSIFSRVHVDFLELQLTENGNSSVVVFIDAFSKYCEAFPLQNHTSLTLAKVFVTQILCRHGAPQSVMSDRGREFLSDLFQSVLEVLGVKQLNTVGWHSQSNGQAENMIRSITSMLRKTVEKKNQWDEQLPFVVLAYNTQKHSSAKFSPYEIVYGRQARLPSALLVENKLDYYPRDVDDYVEELKEKLADCYHAVGKNIAKAQKRQKEYFDSRIKKVNYRIEQKVMVYMPTQVGGKSKKLNRFNYGPYKIVSLTDNDAQVELCTDPEQKLFVNLDRLVPVPIELATTETFVGEKRKRKSVHRRKMIKLNDDQVDRTVRRPGLRDLKKAGMASEPHVSDVRVNCVCVSMRVDQSKTFQIMCDRKTYNESPVLPVDLLEEAVDEDAVLGKAGIDDSTCLVSEADIFYPLEALEPSINATNDKSWEDVPDEHIPVDATSGALVLMGTIDKVPVVKNLRYVTEFTVNDKVYLIDYALSNVHVVGDPNHRSPLDLFYCCDAQPKTVHAACEKMLLKNYVPMHTSLQGLMVQSLQHLRYFLCKDYGQHLANPFRPNFSERALVHVAKTWAESVPEELEVRAEGMVVPVPLADTTGMTALVLVLTSHCQLAKITLLMTGKSLILDLSCPMGLGIGQHDCTDKVVPGVNLLGRALTNARCDMQTEYNIKGWHQVTEVVQIIGDAMGLSLLSTVAMVDRHKVRYTAAATVADAIARVRSIYFGAEVRYAVLCVSNEELAKAEITDENKETVLQLMIDNVKMLLAECAKVEHVWFALSSTVFCSTGPDGPTKLTMMRRLDAAVAELATRYVNVRHAPFAHTFVRNRGFDMALFDGPGSLSHAGSLLLAESIEKYCDVPLGSDAYDPDRREAVSSVPVRGSTSC
jgi:hypothetical protein